MNICLETSSLFPLFAYTSYSIPLYKECGEIIRNNRHIFVYEDSIEEAIQISLISKTRDILNNFSKKQKTNRISLLRYILEYFPGHNFGNNSSRAISLFVLDLLDGDSLDNLTFERFKSIIKERIYLKRISIINALDTNPIIANPFKIFSYWLPLKEELSKLESFNISVLQNISKPSSTKNK